MKPTLGGVSFILRQTRPSGSMPTSGSSRRAWWVWSSTISGSMSWSVLSDQMLITADALI